jgi:1-deoxy-D-xylulose-5-phosphate synthase
MRTAALHKNGPFSIRYPRDAAPDTVPSISEIEAVPYGTWEMLRKGAGTRDPNGGMAILATGTMVLPSVAAAEKLSEDGLNVTVVNCRFIKPHDEEMLAQIVAENRDILVVEEGTVVNGFGAHISAVVAQMDASVRVIAHGVPDRFIEQAPRARQLASVGLDAAGIAARVKQIRHGDARGARLRAG